MSGERITLSGTDWTDPRPMTSWQRDHRDAPLLPMEAEFRGPWRYATWAVTFAVVTLLICALLS